ncbi:hypothetical protein [Paraburkholderia graminis]|uniref:Uncharacterized protein n=1 Tax=Paraburkholderia graminis TaxID=60548 RepID=A0ABD5CB54_9BURK|nr:hypothetical protein [Paraburkholderia graminis]MDR6202519.1 hypothetical protein [Paraburkholderia graminis]
MFPVPSPLDVLVAFAIVFFASVLSTVGLLKYIERLKAAVRTPRAA